MAENVNLKKEIVEAKVEGPWTIAWKRFKKNKTSLAGGIIFFSILLSVIIVPFLVNFGLQGDLGYTGFERFTNSLGVDVSEFPFSLSDRRQAPSSDFWFGTDNQGRDVFFRVFHGGRISMTVGFLTAFLIMFLGTLVGGLAGYYGGIVDDILMRFAEIVLSIPFLPMMIAISASMRWVPPERQMLVVVMVIGILSWPGLSRIVRGQILSLREQEFMEATEILGIGTGSRIFRHLLPNVMTYIIVSTALGIGGAILMEASLSFLGLGVQPPSPSWGNMIQVANDFWILENAPWMWLPPGVFIILTVVSINLLGEGLRDALDPKEIK